MKKIIMSICCMLLALMPIVTYAKGKEKINVYIFYGDGCPHCHKAFEFFDSIKDEYGKYYKLVKYETWYSKSNNEMMMEIAENLEEDTENFGVPYIIIGDKTFRGYTEKFDEDIKNAIKETYENEEYVDKIKPIINKREKEKKETLYTACGSIAALAILVVINSMSRKAFSK